MRISDWSSDVCSSDLRRSPSRCEYHPSGKPVSPSKGTHVARSPQHASGTASTTRTRSAPLPARRGSLCRQCPPASSRLRLTPHHPIALCSLLLVPAGAIGEFSRDHRAELFRVRGELLDLGFLRRDQRSVVQRRAIDQPALFEHFDHCFQVDQFADDAFRICECLAGLHLTETEAQGLADSLRDLRAFLRDRKRTRL